MTLETMFHCLVALLRWSFSFHEAVSIRNRSNCCSDVLFTIQLRSRIWIDWNIRMINSNWLRCFFCSFFLSFRTMWLIKSRTRIHRFSAWKKIWVQLVSVTDIFSSADHMRSSDPALDATESSTTPVFVCFLPFTINGNRCTGRDRLFPYFLPSHQMVFFCSVLLSWCQWTLSNGQQTARLRMTDRMRW